MRNCVVPGCDLKCKNTLKRSMFLVPKNQLAKWEDALQILSRPLKATDRVCHLHFHPDQIQKRFEHIINGKLYHLDRDRMRLKENALPTLNLPKPDELRLKVQKKTRKTKKVNKQATTDEIEVVDEDEPEDETNLNQEGAAQPVCAMKIHYEVVIEEEEAGEDVEIEEEEEEAGEVVEIEEEEEEVPTEEAAHSPYFDVVEELDEIDLIVNEYANETNSSASIEDYECIEPLSKNQQTHLNDTFDKFYDDSFNVTMPSTLWGIHRCPQRSKIFFTYMDPLKLSTTKMLTIERSGSVKIYVVSRLMQTLNILDDVQSVETVSDILLQLHETRICGRASLSEACNITATDSPVGIDLCEICISNATVNDGI